MAVDLEALRKQMEEEERRAILNRWNLEIISEKRENGTLMATCKCLNCDNIFTVQKYKITAGRVKDCGCGVKRRAAESLKLSLALSSQVRRGQRRPVANGTVHGFSTVTDYDYALCEYTTQCICGRERKLPRRELTMRRFLTCGDPRCEELYVNYVPHEKALEYIKNFGAWKFEHLAMITKHVRAGKTLAEAARAMGYIVDGPVRKRLKPLPKKVIRPMDTRV